MSGKAGFQELKDYLGQYGAALARQRQAEGQLYQARAAVANGTHTPNPGGRLRKRFRNSSGTPNPNPGGGPREMIQDFYQDGNQDSGVASGPVACDMGTDRGARGSGPLFYLCPYLRSLAAQRNPGAGDTDPQPGGKNPAPYPDNLGGIPGIWIEDSTAWSFYPTPPMDNMDKALGFPGLLNGYPPCMAGATGQDYSDVERVAALEDEVKRLQAIASGARQALCDVLAYLPEGDGRRLVLTLRYVDMLPWSMVADAAHWSRASCFRKAVQGIEQLLNHPEVREKLIHFETL